MLDLKQNSSPRMRSSQKRQRSQSSSQEASFEETFAYDQSEVLVPPPFVRDDGVLQAIGSSSQSQRPSRNAPIVNSSRMSSTVELSRSKSMFPEVLSTGTNRRSQSRSSYGSQSQPISYDQTSVYDQSLSRYIPPFVRDPEVLQALGYESQADRSGQSIDLYDDPTDTTPDETFPRSLFDSALDESILELDTSVIQHSTKLLKRSQSPRIPSPVPTNSNRQSSDSPASIPSAFAPSTTPPLPDDLSPIKGFRSRVQSSYIEFDGARPCVSSNSTVPTEVTMNEGDRIESSAEAANDTELREEDLDSGVFYERSFDASNLSQETQQTQHNRWETMAATTQVNTQVETQDVEMDHQQAPSLSRTEYASRNGTLQGAVLDRTVAKDRARRSLVPLNKRRMIRPPEDRASNSFPPSYTAQDAPIATLHHALDTPERPNQISATSAKKTIISSHSHSPGFALTSEDTFIPATSSPLHVGSYPPSEALENNGENSNHSDFGDATNVSEPPTHHHSSPGVSFRSSTLPGVLDKPKSGSTSPSFVRNTDQTIPTDVIVRTQSTLSSLPPSSGPANANNQSTLEAPSFLRSPSNDAYTSVGEDKSTQQRRQRDDGEYVLGSPPPKQLVTTQSSELSNPWPSCPVSKSQVTQNDHEALESDSSLSVISSETDSSLSESSTMEAEQEMKDGKTKDTGGNNNVQVQPTDHVDKQEAAHFSPPMKTRQQARKLSGIPSASNTSPLTNQSRSKRVQDTHSVFDRASTRLRRSTDRSGKVPESSNHFRIPEPKRSWAKADDNEDSDMGRDGRDDTIESADDTIWRTEGFPSASLSMATAMTMRNGKARARSTIPTIKVSRRTRLASSESSRLRRIVAARPSVDELELQQMFASGKVQRVFGLYKNSGSFWPGMIVEARFFGDYLLDWDEENSKPSNINIKDLRKCVLRKGDVVWSCSNGAHEFIVAEDYDSFEGIGPDTEIKVSFPVQVLERTLRGKQTLKMRDIVIDRSNVPQMDDRRLFTGDMYVQEPALLTFRSPATHRTATPVPSSNPSATGSGRASSPGRNTRRSGSVEDVARPTKPGCFAGCGFMFTTPTLTEAERSKIQNMIVENGGLVGNDFQNFYHVINSSDSTSIQEELVYRKERRQDELKAVFVLAEQPCRTPKYLKALALGIPCLATTYIQNAVNNGDGWRGYMLSTPFSEHLNTHGSQQFVHPSWSADRSIVRAMIQSTPSHINRPFTNLTMLYLNPKKNERELVIFLCIALGAKSITTTSDLSDPSLSLIFKSFDILVVKDDLKPFPSRTMIGKKGGRLDVVNEEWVKQCAIVGQQVKRMPWKVTCKNNK